MSILAALNKAKQQKQQEQEEQLNSSEQKPDDSYWKYKNGINGKDGFFIGDHGFKSSLQIIGLDDKLIEQWMIEPVIDREHILDYYNNRGKQNERTNNI